MEDTIRAFVTFLKVERNASPETIRGYRSDLQQLASFLLQSNTPSRDSTLVSHGRRSARIPALARSEG